MATGVTRGAGMQSKQSSRCTNLSSQPLLAESHSRERGKEGRKEKERGGRRKEGLARSKTRRSHAPPSGAISSERWCAMALDRSTWHDRDTKHEKGLAFLGVNFQAIANVSTCRKSSRAGDQKHAATEGTRRTLRLKPVKRSAWMEASLENSGTLRGASSWIGRANFATMCSGEPAQRREMGRRLIADTRAIGTAASREGWEAQCPEDLWKEATTSSRAAVE